MARSSRSKALAVVPEAPLPTGSGPLRVDYVPLEALVPYAQNARVHSPDQVKAIARSMAEFGFTNPILTDDDGGIIAGHGRALAARELGYEVVPTILLSGLSPAQRRALVIADNKLALTASWDLELLASELVELRGDGFDLSLTGFADVEIESLTGTAVNAADEWDGMPTFDHVDKTAFRSIVVHFRDAGAVAEFARLNKQTITDKTRMLWWPEIEIERCMDKHYGQGADAAAEIDDAEEVE